MIHDDQLQISPATARRLVAEQFPQHADHELRALDAGGTDNAIFTLGPGIAARFPLRDTDPRRLTEQLHREAAAQRELAAVSPVPSPRPLGIGDPGHGYPLPWSLQTWITGETATPDGLAGSPAFAEHLAGLITALREADTHGRHFDGQGRGGVLAEHDDWVATCLQRSHGLLDVPRLRAIWDELRTAPAPGRVVMSHGDLIPSNLLVSGDTLVGVIDTGGFGPADSALDLIVGIHLLDAPARAVFRRRLGVGGTEWRRALGWAFEQAIGLVWYYRETVPSMAALGESTLDRIIEECDRTR